LSVLRNDTISAAAPANVEADAIHGSIPEPFRPYFVTSRMLGCFRDNPELRQQFLGMAA
jgi:hypothetical protein